MTATLLWRGTVTAASSISHGGETRGTISLLRRELIAQPGGDPVHVPVISGNAARGVLRRLSEELMRDAVGYEHQLPLAAAHVLRGGGALVKTGAEPLCGRRLAELRALLPHLAVFGAATGGRIIDGCLQVGKVVPIVTETTHITGYPATLRRSTPPRSRLTSATTTARTTPPRPCVTTCTPTLIVPSTPVWTPRPIPPRSRRPPRPAGT